MSLPVVSCDFEFRSGVDIALGLPRYFADPEAAVLCLAYDMADGLGPALWTPAGGGDIGVLLDHVRAGGRIRGWNVAFEWHVWNLHMVPKFGWPELTWEQCVDSMAEAAAMNLPQSLAKCGAALGLPQDQLKNKDGTRLIQLLCVPQAEPVVKAPVEYKSKGAYTGALTRHRKWKERGGRWINDPAELQRLYDYCCQDVLAEAAIVRKLRRLSEYEQRVWVMTQVINRRGVPIDTGEIRRISRVVRVESDRLNAELYQLTDHTVGAASEVGQLREWCNARLGPDDQLPDMTAETVDAALLKADAEGATAGGRQVIRALQIRSAIGQTSTAKLPKMLEVVDADGTLKNMHVYHGASTGRDASRGGVNLQNLKSPIVDADQAIEVLCHGDHEWASMAYGDQLMDAAVSSVRGVIKAPDGYEFMDGDFSSVENRVSAWIAGQHDKLELFRQGLDEYKTFALNIFPGVTYEEVTPKQRKFSKPGVLGGMFGQGAVGLVGYAAGMGVHLTLQRSQEITDAYRAEYDRVVACWYACGKASIAAVQEPGKWFNAGPKLKLAVHNNFLFMKLPSGRLIAWAAPLVENLQTPWGEWRDVVTVCQVDAFTKQWKRDKLIGSSIFQSGVQATARDLLMHGMFCLEDAGYRVVLRVHDELLTLNRVGFGSLGEFIRVMCTPTKWSADLPLAGEGWVGPRFRK